MSVQTHYATRLAGIFETKRDTALRCFLLKRGEHTSAFTSLGELTSGYLVEFDENRAENGIFRYSAAATVRDTWAQATHIAYGAPAASKIEVYAFVDDEKDTIDPDASSVYWSGRIVKIENERYTIA